ncbi:MAG TPA: YicC family protein [Lachnoclostridium phytofermentans]|uniref:YicC family protein n=1 Tax=Lachnoclostridium phytofermentans TaxID=66219 RepID=A0A3D2X968_9FIRM|nr:YicC/YloC family endoribonuclease [Lachnoclostridium sp.]HCL03267.1 YicC family protein [Lachnoclostridium phytofermentans]
MLKSMTGFGRCEIDTGERKLIVELKSVNHRYLEISVKLPKKLNFFESGIRNVLKQYISRGKVDVFITYEDYTEGKACVKYNEDIAREYYNGLEKMSRDFGIENDIRASILSRFPDVFTLEEQTMDEQELWELLEKTVRAAAEKFVETRIAEGEHLLEDIHAKLDSMLTIVEFIQEREPQIVAEYRKKLSDKVKELLGETSIDEGVLATEITIFADKICVDEETVRLRAHINNMKSTLNEAVNVGRKLDFIAQEMNREANTILSKANDLSVSNQAIDLKTEIEKIREQIQNIE